MTEIPRRRPDILLPPYSYVPGKFPHPISDPQGHSYGTQHLDHEDFHGNSSLIAPHYELGIDLFNYGYYWEAHEAWEPLWLAAGRTGIEGNFFQGLIKLAAALVKAREGREQGVARHAARAKQLFRRVQEYYEQERNCFMALRLATLVSYTESLIENPANYINTSDEPVVVIGDFVLRLESEHGDA